jgi:hypothetical protein
MNGSRSKIYKKWLDWLDQRGLDTTFMGEIINTQKMLIGKPEGNN